MTSDLHTVWMVFLGLLVVGVVGVAAGLAYACDRRVA